MQLRPDRKTAVERWVQLIAIGGLGSEITQPSSVVGVKFEYSSEDLSLVAFPVMKGGELGHLGVALEFDAGEKNIADSVGDATDAERDDAANVLMHWIAGAWMSVRSRCRFNRGFFGVHDSIWLQDLDSGVTLDESDLL